MQICTPSLSGNQQQASSSPENCRPVVTEGKKGEREKLITAFVEFPHLPLEEVVHLAVPVINVSLSFSLFLPLSPFSFPPL